MGLSRILATWAFPAWVGAAIVACSSGSSGGFATASSGGGGPTGAPGSSSGTSGLVPLLDAAGAFDDPGPERSCGLDEPDADAGDASRDGSTPLPRDPSEECSPPPPSVCAGPTYLARFYAGTCLANLCRWERAVSPCPGGCFRGLDGVDRCNQD
jgi:hypothetical protein